MPKFSQVFLADTKICAKICHALDGEDFDRLVEIGPGAGALTAILFPKYASKMEAVEIDRELIPKLNKKFPSLKITNSDFMKLNIEEMFPNERIAFISNLPYDCSTAILEKVLNFSHLACAVFMFQKEVGLRIQAKPREAEYGLLSVMTNMLAETSLVCIVKAGSFRPIPAVDSAVIKFYPKKVNVNIEKVQNLARKAFTHRRKTMLNSLVLCGMDKKNVLTAMQACAIPEKARAQDISTDLYIKLADLL